MTDPLTSVALYSLEDLGKHRSLGPHLLSAWLGKPGDMMQALTFLSREALWWWVCWASTTLAGTIRSAWELHLLKPQGAHCGLLMKAEYPFVGQTAYHAWYLKSFLSISCFYRNNVACFKQALRLVLDSYVSYVCFVSSITASSRKDCVLRGIIIAPHIL